MSITICDFRINVDKDNPNIEPFMNGTTTTLISGDLDVSCTILSGECNKSFVMIEELLTNVIIKLENKILIYNGNK